MLDSGAFTARTEGAEIRVQDYAEFCKRVLGWCRLVISLDKMPSATVSVEAAAAESFDNWRRLRDAGLPVCPVYHDGEDLANLHRYLEAGADRIALSPAGRTRTSARRFFKTCFGQLCGADGWPSVPVHGLGVHQAEFWRTFPFHSVDSSAWMYYANSGCVLVPARGPGGVPDLGLEPIVVSVSTNAKYRRLRPDSALWRWASEWLELCGTTWAEVSASWHSRRVVCLEYHRAAAREAVPRPYVQSRIAGCGSARGVPVDSLCVYWVDWWRRKAVRLLLDSGERGRVVSYWFARTRSVHQFRHYVRTGVP